MKRFLLILYFVSSGFATQVQRCPGNSGVTPKDLSERVKVGNCQKGPCRLRKDSFIDVELKFIPDMEITGLKNSVSANILGIPFPFVGVDGEDACRDIFKADGTKVGCNLKVGEEYIYKNKIEVLKIYPKIKTMVHWGLTMPNGKDVICFEVPARITD